MRAIDHCVESLCAIEGTTNASDELAKHALSLLVPGLLHCKQSREDRDAHLKCQLGSIDAMAACTSGSIELGASHGIGHQVCAMCSRLYIRLHALDIVNGYYGRLTDTSSVPWVLVTVKLAASSFLPCASSMRSIKPTARSKRVYASH